ncbi:MAG TPA: sugar ABC transporter ATP-binding protein [Polyangiaceae bacterium]|nr:sugar ABC transporter ATP-binding protein [Polyangiaceae bacterium]
MHETLLVASGLQKTFGATRALRGVDLEVRAGEIHALVGENGAGKSTLMGILSGAIAPDVGSMELGGAPFRPAGPRASRQSGVLLVHQELSLCGHMTVAENVMLGVEPARFGFLERRKMRAKATEALAAVTGKEGTISLDARAADLSPADRQLVEIARALAIPQCRILLLDEPTSSLAAGDVDRLFSLLRELKQRSLAIVYISHFLEEIMRVCDVYTVLRDGQVAAKGSIADIDANKLVLAMTGGVSSAGASPIEDAVRADVDSKEPVLVVDDVAGVRKPLAASLTVHRGEVVGIAGLLGAGRTELLRLIFGLDPVARGTIKVAGYVGPASPAKRIAQGVGFLSEDRKGEGLALGLPVADNLALSRLSGLGPGPVVVPSRLEAAARRWIERLGIRTAGPWQPVRELSGGNQQKVALARWLTYPPRLLVLCEPTRGMDVGAKNDVINIVRNLRAKGLAIIVLSTEPETVLSLADRILVLKRGVVVREFVDEAVSKDRLLEAA